MVFMIAPDCVGQDSGIPALCRRLGPVQRLLAHNGMVKQATGTEKAVPRVQSIQGRPIYEA